MQITASWSAIRLISETIGTLPLHLYRRTDKGREKVQKELEEIHQLFKDFIKRQRTDLDVAKVATGEHWLGSRALELGLIDQLSTSDDYLMAARETADIVEVKYVSKQGLKEKLSSLISLRRGQLRGIDGPMIM